MSIIFWIYAIWGIHGIWASWESSPFATIPYNYRRFLVMIFHILSISFSTYLYLLSFSWAVGDTFRLSGRVTAMWWDDFCPQSLNEISVLSTSIFLDHWMCFMFLLFFFIISAPPSFFSNYSFNICNCSIKIVEIFCWQRRLNMEATLSLVSFCCWHKRLVGLLCFVIMLVW